MSGHSFCVDARCECGVAMSFLIRAGAEVAKRAADLLRESILNPDSDLSDCFARLNLALIRYSASKHQEGDVAIALGEIEESGLDGQGCGCCGRHIADPENDGPDMILWCADCLGHVLQTGAFSDRTHYAQFGKDCPFQI